MAKNDINNFYCKRPRKSRKQRAFEVWYNYLYAIANNIFKYRNLPANLPAMELEKRLILQGYALIVETTNYGIVCATGGIYGVSIYNTATKFNFAQATLGSKSDIINNVGGIIVYSSSTDKIRQGGGYLGDLISYYADLLSDIDVSLEISIINNRAVNTIGAKSDSALSSLREFQSKLYEGEITIPKLDTAIFDATENIIKQEVSRQNTLSELSDVQTMVLKRFYNSIGIPYLEEKAERLISDEVATTKECLSANLFDLLQHRQEGINQINKLYGTNIIVEVNNNEIT